MKRKVLPIFVAAPILLLVIGVAWAFQGTVSNHVIVQSPYAVIFGTGNGSGDVYLKAGAANTFTTNGTMTPSTAAGVGLGTSGLPFSNLILGTAATNAFTFTPAATAAARTVTIPDPGASPNLTLTPGLTAQKTETGSADASVLSLTPVAAAGTYRACLNASVSSATSGIIAWTLSYKNSNSVAQTNDTMPLFQQGTAAPNTTFTTSAAGEYQGCWQFDIDNSATAIVVKWVGGGTTAAKVSATIERLQ